MEKFLAFVTFLTVLECGKSQTFTQYRRQPQRVIDSPSNEDLYYSNQVCINYFKSINKEATQYTGECEVKCGQYENQFACATKKPLCLDFATFTYQNSRGRYGKFYCNVLPREVANRNFADDYSVMQNCAEYKRNLQQSQYVYPCEISCSNAFIVQSNNGQYYERMACESNLNFDGCRSFANFLTAKGNQLKTGEYRCEVYDHGDDFDYQRQPTKTTSSGSRLTDGFPTGETNYNQNYNGGSLNKNPSNNGGITSNQNFNAGNANNYPNYNGGITNNNQNLNVGMTTSRPYVVHGGQQNNQNAGNYNQNSNNKNGGNTSNANIQNGGNNNSNNIENGNNNNNSGGIFQSFLPRRNRTSIIGGVTNTITSGFNQGINLGAKTVGFGVQAALSPFQAGLNLIRGRGDFVDDEMTERKK